MPIPCIWKENRSVRYKRGFYRERHEKTVFIVYFALSRGHLNDTATYDMSERLQYGSAFFFKQWGISLLMIGSRIRNICVTRVPELSLPR